MNLDAQPKIGAYGVDNDRGASLDPAPMSCGCHRWHCLLTKHGQHALAERTLAQDGWRTYFPLHLDRHNSRIGPLFGQYAFVAFDPSNDQWPRIYGARGVFTILSRDRRPLPLPVGLIEDLQARTSARRIVDDPGERPEASRIRAGASGTVVQGPWAGWGGLCTLSRRDRLTLLLSAFGRLVPIEFRHDQVVAA
jgi:transcription antitermination factor NusG